jgi:hypothetical protein
VEPTGTVHGGAEIGSSGRDGDVDADARTARRDELGRALRAVRGVAAASVVAGPDGRDRLRLRLAPGEAVAPVQLAVSTTLRERFGIDVAPEAVRLLDDDGDATGGPELGGRARPEHAERRRAALSRPGRSRAGIVEVEVAPVASDETRVRVRLAYGRRTVTCRSRAIPVQPAVRRAVAEATLEALRDLTDGQLLAAVDEVRPDPPDDPFAVTVVVTAITPRGELRTVGSALVDGDVAVAVARATLDAMNRHVEPLLSATPHDPAG